MKIRPVLEKIVKARPTGDQLRKLMNIKSQIILKGTEDTANWIIEMQEQIRRQNLEIEALRMKNYEESGSVIKPAEDWASGISFNTCDTEYNEDRIKELEAFECQFPKSLANTPWRKGWCMKVISSTPEVLFVKSPDGTQRYFDCPDPEKIKGQWVLPIGLRRFISEIGSIDIQPGAAREFWVVEKRRGEYLIFKRCQPEAPYAMIPFYKKDESILDQFFLHVLGTQPTGSK